MTRSKFLLAIFLVSMVAWCNAQTPVNGSTATTTKNTSFHSLYLFNHYPGFYSGRIPSFKHDFYKMDQDNFRRLFSNTTYPERNSLKLDYAPFPTAENFSSLSRRDFYNHYDPSNPYGVTNPAEGILYGSLDYLVWKIFKDK